MHNQALPSKQAHSQPADHAPHSECMCSTTCNCRAVKGHPDPLHFGSGLTYGHLIWAVTVTAGDTVFLLTDRKAGCLGVGLFLICCTFASVSNSPPVSSAFRLAFKAISAQQNHRRHQTLLNMINSSKEQISP